MVALQDNMNHPLRKKYSDLRRAPGPKPTWQKRAAQELGFSRPYISMLIRGRRTSPAALAALNEWRKLNKVA
jgi:hypothetical protein